MAELKELLIQNEKPPSIVSVPFIVDLIIRCKPIIGHGFGEHGLRIVSGCAR